ncbi:transcriptional regulator family: Fungal Specific TF [Paecilomyces variotii]|nr:transcriptional regulator family: Fungal Specific TF [Paecilomyces variotii]
MRLRYSPGSTDDIEDHDGQEDKRRQPVKRACNECRQQKLRCDVVQDPFTTCSRCRRLKLECKIESNFKRIGKRSRNAEMEREIIELRKQVANANAAAAAAAAASMNQQQPQLTPTKQETPSISTPISSAAGVYQGSSGMSADQYMGSHEAVASLLDLRSGFDGSSGYMRNGGHQFKRIEDVMVAPERVTELFNLFFTFYHPFLPFLDRDQSPDDYYSTSPLLFWTIISVGARRYQTDSHLLNSLAAPVTRLVWSTLADIPQSYHVVKPLCLLCTWPFPTSSTSTDPTFMLCGMMMQVAMQLGLHRPSHTQDFSKFRIELMEEELRDKVRTWAVCNIVAQRVATGYGQPPSTLYDWTLSSGESADPNFKLPSDIRSRLDIENFCDKITKALYNNRRDPVGLSSDSERSAVVSLLSRDFDDLEDELRSDNDAITELYLRASNLHLHLSAFFDNPTAKDYREGLLSLHSATTAFLESALNLETHVGPVLSYTPYYIYQMMLAAGFTLLKLCKSFFAAHIDLEYSRNLFNRTIWAIRAISVSNNDLPERLAEVLAQMWRLGGTPSQRPTGSNAEIDDSLQLRVRCRMSMSLVYDSVWRWREDAQTRGRNIEAYLKNPTNPDSSADNSATSSTAPGRNSSTPAVGGGDPSLAPAPSMPSASLGMTPANGGVSGLPSNFMEPNYEVFDPLNWLLDGLVDFPYSYNAVQGLETQGIA